MFFDLGWSELLVIGAVALVVIGPKELPNALRTAGFWVRKARSLSREFQGSVEQMIREAELDEVRRDLKKATEFDLEHEFHKAVDATGPGTKPQTPDYLDETAPKLAASSEGSPVPIPPPEMIGFDEPVRADAAAGPPISPPDEPAPSKA
jgi:sec-independent protein translocase protein TatB